MTPKKRSRKRYLQVDEQTVENGTEFQFYDIPPPTFFRSLFALLKRNLIVRRRSPGTWKTFSHSLIYNSFIEHGFWS